MASISGDIKRVLEEILDDNLRNSVSAGLAALGLDEKAKSDKQNLVTLYSLEYQKAAERYQSIYTSIWTNFSYMSVVAGALLTLGSNLYTNVSLTAFLASLPLIFWYVVSYIPMNKYGNDIIHRLKEIEEILEDEFGAKLDHFKKFDDRIFPRVRPAMFVFGALLIFLSCWFACQYFSNRSYLLEVGDLTVTEGLAKRLIPDISPSPPPSPSPTQSISSAESNKTAVNNSETSSSSSPQSQSPADGSTTQTVKSQNSSCEKIQLQKATGIDEIIQPYLTETTLKSLCEVKQGNSGANSKEFQRSITNDFNKALENKFFCDQNQDLCNDAQKAIYSSSKKSVDDLIYANRLVLEEKYDSKTIAPVRFPYLLIAVGFVYILILLVVIYEFYLIAQEMKLSHLKKLLKKNEFIITSIQRAAGSSDMKVTPDVLVQFSKLMRSKKAKLLLMQILPLTNLDDYKWKKDEDEDLRVTAFVEINGQVKLEELNREKVENFVDNHG
jgi:hypothetical protein